MVKRLSVLFLCAIAMILVAVYFATRVSVDKAVNRDAVDKAMYYAEYMAVRIPNLPSLIEDPRPDGEQIRIIRDIRNLGHVFRFKLFDPQGRLVLMSDDQSIRNGGSYTGVVDPEPAIVARTHEPIVDVFDGSEKPNRPDYYSEAYVPLLDADGQTYGVAEVYIDQTGTRAYFHDSFRTFGLVLGAFCVFLFGAPYAGYQAQRVMANRARNEAEFLASYDPLTGLMNRREFVAHAEKLIDVGDLSAVCFVDVDKFKAVNDLYGHAAGDQYLTYVSDIMRSHTEPGDLVARFGGDEFVIGFKRRGIDGVTSRIRSIVSKASENFQTEKLTITGSISVGVAQYAKDQMLDVLLSQADAALYHAKANGKNTFSIYGDEMGEDLRRRNALEKRLREATQEKDFTIKYQPLVDGKSKEVLGYEALLRLSDEDGSDIPPSTFIPVAEELGIIDQIGVWVIETAIREIALLSETHGISINLSPAQFRDGKLPEIVRNALELANFAPERLELEITESLLLEDDPKIEFQIDALKDMGVSIAMDDFGTGFSSLSYLWKFGFDRLKIDRSFIAALDCDPARSQEIIEVILLLGERLGMRTTAEGIETSAQSDLLTALGCDVLQGYLFGHPADLQAFEQDTPGGAAGPRRSDSRAS